MMLAFANQAIPVWFYMFIGIPTLFVGLMIATTPPPLSSETALQRYLNEDAATVRRGRLRRRLAWGGPYPRVLDTLNPGMFLGEAR